MPTTAGFSLTDGPKIDDDIGAHYESELKDIWDGRSNTDLIHRVTYLISEYYIEYSIQLCYIQAN